MKLSELLDHVAVHVLDDRTAMLNGSPDTLWSHEVLCRYFRRAEEEFCRKAWVLKDSATAACCEVALVAEVKDYALHSSVLRVLSATPADSDIDLVRVDYGTLRPRYSALPGEAFDVNVQYLDAPGRPRWYATDVATKMIRVRPAPRAEDVTDIGELVLRVARLPINPLTASDLDADPEIPAEYHMDLCDYVAFRALSHPNVDAEGKREAKEFSKAFYAAVRDAKADVHTAEHAVPSWNFGGWAST
jgi:hypothetical protein